MVIFCSYYLLRYFTCPDELIILVKAKQDF